MKMGIWGIFFLSLSLFTVANANEIVDKEQSLTEGYRVVPISMEQLVSSVVKQNSNVILNAVKADIAQKRIDFEHGILDPIFNFSFYHRNNYSPDSVITGSYSLDPKEYKDDTDDYSAGVGGLLPIGTRWDIKVKKSSVRGDILSDDPNTDTNYHSNDLVTELTLRQPLMKGFGEDNTLIQLNIAKANHRMVLNEYKKNMMDLVGATIQIYWRLYGQQEVYKSWLETLEIAKKQEKFIELQVSKGKMPMTELYLIQSAIITRTVELQKTKSKIMQLNYNILTLLNLSSSANENIIFKVTDSPLAKKTRRPRLSPLYREALKNWPEFDYLQQKVKIAKLKLKHSENSELVQLDAIANMKMNGVEYDTAYPNNPNNPSRFLNDDYNSWYVGLEMKMPLFNTQANKTAEIDQLNYMQAQYNFMSAKRKLNNELADKINQYVDAQVQMVQYMKGEEIRKKLLDAELARFKFGKITIRDFLNEQEKYITFQRQAVNNITRYNLAKALLEKSTGKLLKRFKIDVTRKVDYKINKDKKYEYSK